MSVPYRTLVSFLPLLAFLLAVVPGRGQQPAPADGGRPSAWWYPLGNPEANRNNPVPTASQKAQDLQFKWRTGRLKNSPVLLVGAIRTQSGEAGRQIVGMEEGSNRVTILTSAGFVDTTFQLGQYLEDEYFRLRLTGLFNSAAPNVTPSGKPDLIGIGVEDTLKANPGLPISGMLVSHEGRLIRRLSLRDSAETGRVAANRLPGSRVVGVYPAAAYTPAGAAEPISLAVINQPFYNPFYENGRRVDTLMINSIRLYSFNMSSQSLRLATPYTTNGVVALAPKTYAQPPALMYDTGAKASFIAVSNTGYTFDSLFSVRSQGISNVISWSRFGGVAVAGIENQALTPLYVDSTRFAGGTAHAHFFENFSTDTAARSQERALIMAEQQSSSLRPRIFFDRFARSGFVQDNFVSESTEQFHSGWDIVAADLDGTAPGEADPLLANNLGYEFLASWKPTGKSPAGANWLYMFRHNLQYRIGFRPFYYVTRQQLAGSVIAAGDLVADEFGRQEVIVVNGGTLQILQLKPYSDEEIAGTQEEIRKPFTTLAEFIVGDSILSVAIADLEGDGENDIVLCTTDSTYAIGKIGPNPYEFLTDPDPFGREYCPDDTIAVEWKRNVGSEDTKVEVNIIGESLRRQFGQSDIAGDKITFLPSKVLINSQTFRVQPGEYRIVVSNLAYPNIADTSRPFTVVESAISQFDFATSAPYEIGSVVADTIALACVDSAWVQRSVGDSASWVDVREAVTRLDEGRMSFADTLVCPEILRCGADQEQYIYYRIVTGADTLPLRRVQVSVPKFTFDLTPGGASLSRRRSLEWNAADFPCDELVVSLSGDNGETWQTAGEAGTAGESFEFTVPEEFEDFVLVCLQCGDPGECGYGVQRFAVSRVDMANYVYPNPFDPEMPTAGGGGAEIVYSLKNSGTVSITVYDASRSVVQEIIKGEEREAGRNRGDFWDGKNLAGQNVANGTYICVISSSSGEQIILPIAVVKRR